MAPSTLHLPNGHNLTVTPVFGGLSFKSIELNLHHTPFPPGWTVVINSEDDDLDHLDPAARRDSSSLDAASRRTHHVHRFRQPSLRNDHLFISSISNPSNSDFRPAVSPTRQIAMMLWATLWWYFHQPEPEPQMTTAASVETADAGKPKGQWIVNVNREGILKGKNLIPKLERMGLLVSEDSSVGCNPDEKSCDYWSNMFISKRHFWQIDARIFLFNLSPTASAITLSGSNSRSSSPNRGAVAEPVTPPLGAGSFGGPGPFQSGSNLPTYYPPPPATYVSTNAVRHPLRAKPPRQGEVFYTRYVPSLGEYLSFRVASLSQTPVAYHGPVGSNAVKSLSPAGGSGLRNMSIVGESLPNMATTHASMSDVEYLHKWMNDPRVAYSWGEDGPVDHQQAFLEAGLTNRHSFPVIGCFDGKPFGYFEIYWVREDRLGAYIGKDVGDYDRGIHCLVGEQEFRGSHRVKVWLSALVHHCLLADARTEVVMLEPRVDNEKLKRYCEQVGFYKEREISFPHKQSNLMKIRREAWDGPVL